MVDGGVQWGEIERVSIYFGKILRSREFNIFFFGKFSTRNGFYFKDFFIRRFCNIIRKVSTTKRIAREFEWRKNCEPRPGNWRKSHGFPLSKMGTFDEGRGRFNCVVIRVRVD